MGTLPRAINPKSIIQAKSAVWPDIKVINSQTFYRADLI